MIRNAFRSEFFSARILQVVDVEARTLAVARLIEANHPLLHLVEVRGLGRDDQERVPIGVFQRAYSAGCRRRSADPRRSPADRGEPPTSSPRRGTRAGA